MFHLLTSFYSFCISFICFVHYEQEFYYSSSVKPLSILIVGSFYGNVCKVGIFQAIHFYGANYYISEFEKKEMR